MNIISWAVTGLGLVISSFIMKEENDGQPSLYEGQWKLQKIHCEAKVLTADEKTFIHFDQLKQSAGGNGGCNVFGSTVTVNGQSIRFSDIFSTKMYCDGVQAREDLFFQLLRKSDRFEINGQQLVLYHDKDVLLEFVHADK
jgi:heat shock protein HslJ